MIRRATVDDAEAIARIHVQAWREAYRGIVPAEYLASLAPLRRREVAAELVSAFAALKGEGVNVTHFAIMQNHWHALLNPIGPDSIDLHGVMTRLKGRTARAVNLALGLQGTLWQREWFDRWIRDDAEWHRGVEYIHQNPVKAGLVRDWRDDPWAR